jgi:hypothetical protein
MAQTALQTIPTTKAAVTADSTPGGVITIASNTPFVKGAIAYLNGTGLPTLTVMITEIIATTKIGVRAIQERGSTNPVNQKVSGPNYGNSDTSLYTLAAASSITQPAQALFGDGSQPIPASS